MTTVLNRDSIKVKRDLQKRVENWVAQYCEALEENFKQYSIRSYKTNIKRRYKISQFNFKRQNELSLTKFGVRKSSVCKREIKFYSKIDKDKNFDWVNIHNNTEKIKNTGLSKKELLSILHIQNEKGSIFKGVDAFAIMWSKFQYLKPLSFALKFKPINIFANFLYKLWLKTRQRILTL